MALCPTAEAFEAAKKEFISSVRNGEPEVSHFASISEVYDATEEIQNEQSKSGTLRNLRMIQPYLDCLNHYAGVIETFAQVKPDVISLIWGPIKMILLVTKTYVKGYEKIWDAMAQVGARLPQFEKYARVFEQYSQIKQVLCLFYKDILEFHFTLLEFFHLNKRRMFFESIWPKYFGKIQLIIENIEKHRNLMDSEVTLANIMEADAARLDAYRRYEQNQEFQQRQDFNTAKTSLSPALYDHELERIKRECSVQSGNWLETLEQFRSWLDPSKSTTRLFWLQGIPGAGKTFLTSLITRRIKERKDPLAFAFLSYQARDEASTLKVLHSFIFQLAIEDQSLQPLVCFAHKNSPRELSSSVDFAQGLLKDLLKNLPATYIVIDGLDEILEVERIFLLDILLGLHIEHDNLNLLFSSRAEHDISRLLEPKAQPTRVQDRNSQDIQVYVEKRRDGWLRRLDIDLEIANEVRLLMENIGERAKGMFMYARLVCDNLELQTDLDAIKEEAANLPSGLNEAYGRIMVRIQQDLRPQERREAKQILEWVGCSLSPVSENEIKLALLVSRGGDLSKGPRGIFTNIFQRCGPIIETVNGFIQFVHFSAREYLFHTHSGRYLKEADGHANIASACIRYLSSDCFDPHVQDSSMQEFVVKGSYVLENYAYLHWFDHVQKCADVAPETISNEIKDLAGKRANLGFDRTSGTNSSNLVYKVFQKFPVDLHEILLDMSAFWRSRNHNFCFETVESWKNFDPLIISAQHSRIQTRLETILCSTQATHEPGCKCTVLQSTYGTCLYKCSRPGCPRFRTGFDSNKERVNHIQAHNRPFKCDSRDCPYREFGFTTKALLQDHTNKLHNNNIGTPLSQLDTISDIEDARTIIEDAIIFNDLDLVRSQREVVRSCGDILIPLCVTRRSSSEMLRLLVEICKGRKYKRLEILTMNCSTRCYLCGRTLQLRSKLSNAFKPWKRS
ncbi:uncharacterized protein K452DRAFT_90147 [Aplosporella prunicola CBS 121167]|uniref:NACHT domain-containing protein n=1 Tax=Aplosporella prunicola CBS 121167 TaxID=1176127 RepID=A0A6A6B4N8_9PEZI|nr:uncharacterized protein K452DRAFT_90147 [Aplosporella prunicola CBS 121167]KAF2138225.1 hypothetical protein K452DRAFT_90147 [Aplosporella prunicola CBS 121167]